MSNSTDIYASYFSVGMKVGVGIPAPGSEVFRDWALIHAMDEDLVFLQLSRDQLPVDVTLHVGQIIELRGGKQDAGYSCRAIIVSEEEESRVLLRLIGEIVTDELREFYRIDAFLPVKYHVTAVQAPRVLEQEWNRRREERLAEELLRKQQQWETRLNVRQTVEQQEQLPDGLVDGHATEEQQSWDNIIPLAANISGGGIRIIAHHAFEVGEYVLLEVMVPIPDHIVDAVARVVAVRPSRYSLEGRESFDVSLKYINIHERDRDAIVNYISNIQLKRIRQLRMQFAFRDSFSGEKLPSQAKLKNIRQLILGGVLFVFTALLIYYMWGYATNRPKHEIEEIFERGIKQYLRQSGR